MTSTALDARDCEAIVRLLWPFLDAALPDSDRAAVAEHLRDCSGCRSHFDFARAFLDAVHAAGATVRDDEGLRRRVVEALAAEGFHG